MIGRGGLVGRLGRLGLGLVVTVAVVFADVTTALGIKLDGLPGAAVVAVAVAVDLFGSRPVTSSIVDNGNRLVVSLEGCLGEVGLAASPVDLARRRLGASADPGTEADLHGSLREPVGDGSLLDGVDYRTVDAPFDGVPGPFDAVGVQRAKRVVDGVVGDEVMLAAVSLAKRVGLDLV